MLIVHMVAPSVPSRRSRCAGAPTAAAEPEVTKKGKDKDEKAERRQEVASGDDGRRRSS